MSRRRLFRPAFACSFPSPPVAAAYTPPCDQGKRSQASGDRFTPRIRRIGPLGSTLSPEVAPHQAGSDLWFRIPSDRLGIECRGRLKRSPPHQSHGGRSPTARLPSDQIRIPAQPILGRQLPVRPPFHHHHLAAGRVLRRRELASPRQSDYDHARLRPKTYRSFVRGDRG